MKQHLFYTFLGIFIATATITLLGITNVIPIQEKYLTPLFAALLIELVGAVIAIYKQADFFNDSQPEKIESAKQTIQASISIQKTEAQPVKLEIEPTEQPKQEPNPIEKVEIQPAKLFIDRTAGVPWDLDLYLEKREALTGRFREVQKLEDDTEGQDVFIIGRVNNIFAQKEQNTISVALYSIKHKYEWIGVYFPERMEADIFSLQKNDVIEVTGKVSIKDTAMPRLVSSDYSLIRAAKNEEEETNALTAGIAK